LATTGVRKVGTGTGRYGFTKNPEIKIACNSLKGPLNKSSDRLGRAWIILFFAIIYLFKR